MEFRSIPPDGSCGGTCNYLANSLTANHIRGVTFHDSSGSQLFKTLSIFSNSLFQNVPEPTQHLQSDQVTFVQAAHLTAFLKYLCGRRTLLLSFHVIRIPLPPDCSAYCDAKFSPFCRWKMDFTWLFWNNISSPKLPESWRLDFEELNKWKRTGRCLAPGPALSTFNKFVTKLYLVARPSRLRQWRTRYFLNFLNYNYII